MNEINLVVWIHVLSEIKIIIVIKNSGFFCSTRVSVSDDKVVRYDKVVNVCLLYRDILWVPKEGGGGGGGGLCSPVLGTIAVRFFLVV